MNLFDEGPGTPPPDGERSLPYLEGRDEGGTYRKEEGVPLEGGTLTREIEDLPEPPSEWLSTIWEGTLMPEEL